MITNFKLKDGRIVSIKRLTAEDYEKNNNYEFVHDWLYDVNMYLDLEFEKKDLEKDKEIYYKALSDAENFFNIGAIFDNKIIASSSLTIESRNKRKHVGIWGIAIHPSFHNKGLGMRLLILIEDLAREKGLKKLEAAFYSGNDAAKKLYVKKLNYKIEGRQKFAVLLKDGMFADKILIGKILEKNFFFK